MYVDPNGLAAKHGLQQRARSVLVGSEFCYWCLTEINSRPLDLSFKSNEVSRFWGTGQIHVGHLMKSGDGSGAYALFVLLLNQNWKYQICSYCPNLCFFIGINMITFRINTFDNNLLLGKIQVKTLFLSFENMTWIPLPILHKYMTAQACYSFENLKIEINPNSYAWNVVHVISI